MTDAKLQNERKEEETNEGEKDSGYVQWASAYWNSHRRYGENLCVLCGAGFEKVYETVLSGDQRVVFLRFCNLVLECYEGECAGRAGAVDHIAIDCRDIEAAYALAEEKGIPSSATELRSFPSGKMGCGFSLWKDRMQ